MKQAKVIPVGKRAPKKRAQAIIASTDAEIEQMLISVLREFWLQPVLTESLDEIEALLTEEETLMAFSQAKFDECSIREVIRVADIPGGRVPVIVCSEFYDEDFYIDAMSMGAFDYLAFPYSREEVELVVNNAVK